MLRNNQQDLQDEGNQKVESPAQGQQVLPESIPPPQLPAGLNPEKQKLIQQQLVLLIHAHKCISLDLQNQANGVNKQCNLPHCKTLKNVLGHLRICNEGMDCPFPHCSFSRQTITHWKNCTRPDCPICSPLKKKQDRNAAVPVAVQAHAFPNSMRRARGFDLPKIHK